MLDDPVHIMWFSHNRWPPAKGSRRNYSASNGDQGVIGKQLGTSEVIELDKTHHVFVQIYSCTSLNPEKLPSSSFVRVAMVRGPSFELFAFSRAATQVIVLTLWVCWTVLGPLLRPASRLLAPLQAQVTA